MGHIDNKLYLYSIILLFFVGHLVYLNTPFVNLEWVYKIGSYYFMNSDNAYLDIYLSEQANPITYSFLSSLMTVIFGDSFFSYRILALTGGIIILICMAKYKDPFLLLIIGLNPLIWVYSGRAYSELLSAGLLVLAIELSNNRNYSRGVIAGVAASIKYHTILFSGPYWGLKWLESYFYKKDLLLKNPYLIHAIISCIFFIAFLIYYLYAFDIWIMPDKYKSTHSIQFLNILDNFFSYGFYISALFCITIPHILTNTKIKSHLIALCISIPLALINQDNGEMNFGSLDQLLGSELILVIKIVGFWNFLLCLEWFLKNKTTRVTALSIICFLLILSFTRPAQRYLIFVIPFWALIINLSDIKIIKLFKWGYVVALAFVALFTSLYQVENAKASKSITDWGEKNNLRLNTYEIYAHVGDSRIHSDDANLIVLSTIKGSQEVLYSSSVRILGHELRKYFVVRKDKD